LLVRKRKLFLTLFYPKATLYYIMPIEERKKIWQEVRTKSMKQLFFLPEVTPSVRLVFEPLSYQNGMQLFDIFKNDDNQFVDERFKNEEEVEDYLASMLEYACFSTKRAAFDWLIKLETTGEYIGVFHLHDLSNQVFGSENRKASIGYAVGKAFRGHGFATETVAHFSDFIFKNSSIIKLLVYTEHDNLGSIRLMQTLNWQYTDEKYVYSDDYAYFELWKEGYLSMKYEG
jgi:RimJ/RimL family protein N-acetyltransferase